MAFLLGKPISKPSKWGFLTYLLAFEPEYWMICFYYFNMSKNALGLLCVFAQSLIDLVHLTHANLQDGFLSYNRRKTGTLVRIHVNSGLRKVMDDYRVSGSAYLFSVLSEGKDSYADYKTALRWYNTCLKEIGKRLSNPVRLTSYVIRHTWATEAYKQYIPVAVISQALGHTSEKTTRCYLGDLDQSELDKANALVTDSLSAIILNRA